MFAISLTGCASVKLVLDDTTLKWFGGAVSVDIVNAGSTRANGCIVAGVLYDSDGNKLTTGSLMFDYKDSNNMDPGDRETLHGIYALGSTAYRNAYKLQVEAMWDSSNKFKVLKVYDVPASFRQ